VDGTTTTSWRALATVLGLGLATTVQLACAAAGAAGTTRTSANAETRPTLRADRRVCAMISSWAVAGWMKACRIGEQTDAYASFF
jgi:hypothetical protein